MTQQPRRLNVLVVEDEPLLSWALVQTLTSSGCHVLEATSGEAAVRALNEAVDPIDVVLLDYRLPDVTHLELLSTIRRMSPDSQIVLMSARLTPEITWEALALVGAQRVVSKPFDMQEVEPLVQKAAARRHYPGM